MQKQGGVAWVRIAQPTQWLYVNGPVNFIIKFVQRLMGPHQWLHHLQVHLLSCEEDLGESRTYLLTAEG